MGTIFKGFSEHLTSGERTKKNTQDKAGCRSFLPKSITKTKCLDTRYNPVWAWEHSKAFPNCTCPTDHSYTVTTMAGALLVRSCMTYDGNCVPLSFCSRELLLQESLWEVSDPLCYREEGRWPPTLSLLFQVFCCFFKYTQGCHLALKPLMPLAPTDAHWHMRDVQATAASRSFFHL